MDKRTGLDNNEQLHTFTSVDGTPIAFSRSGEGPPLVLLHGCGLNHHFWDLSGCQAALARHCLVYALDRRGHGQSGDAEDYDLNREIDDVVALTGRIGEPVILLGHTYGALVALEAALRIDHLRGLILYEPFAFKEDGSGLQEMQAAVQGDIADGDKEATLLAVLEAMHMPNESIDELLSSTKWPEIVNEVETLNREMNRILAYQFEQDRFKHLKTPTLLLAGGEQPPSLFGVTETLFETLQNSRIVYLEGQNHWAMNRMMERFIIEVVSFIRELD